VWIIQELAVCGLSSKSSGLIVCGQAYVERILYSYACAIILALIIHGNSYNSETNKLEEPLRSVITRGHALGLSMFQISAASNSAPARGLDWLLLATRRFEASDPRDKMYALLCIATKDDKAFLPDYHKSVSEVLRNLVKIFIKKNGNLNILRENRYRMNPFGPSWAPDLSSQIHGDGG